MRPNYIVLGHELVHAYGITSGTFATGSSDFTFTNGHGQPVTVRVINEELVTVGLRPGRPVTENDLLREHRLAIRGTYSINNMR
jgi:hypothetical protein